MFAKRRIKAPMSEDRALGKLAEMCSAAEHCQREMFDKAVAWGLSAEAASRVVQRLVSERFVDDARFAPAFVRDKARFSGWGPVKVRMQLLAKGVDEVVVDDALAAFDSDEWHGILCKAIAAKLRCASQSDPRKLFASVVRFGLQRGFSYEAVKRALAEVRENAGGSDADNVVLELDASIDDE